MSDSLNIRLCITCASDKKTPLVVFGFQSCPICEVNYDIITWRHQSNPHARKLRTYICIECAFQKSVCQCCLMDLKYEIPVSVRNSIFNIPMMEIPQDKKKRQIFLQRKDNFMGLLPHTSVKSKDDPRYFPTAYYDMPQQSQRCKEVSALLTHQKSRKILPFTCYFYVNSTCNRSPCPFYHEKNDIFYEPSVKNIRDRYHGYDIDQYHHIFTQSIPNS